MTSKVSSSLDGDLIWSSANFTMRDFVDAFQDHLPILVKTTAGYAGFDEDMHQIGSGEIYLVSDIQRQKRLVVQPEKSDCFLSIPAEYPVKVQILQEGSKKVGSPVSIQDVLDLMLAKSSPDRMMFENNQSVSFQIGADLGSSAKLGVLSVMQTYEEKYLLANTVFGRTIFLRARGIPVYLPIEFVTAAELRVGGEKALGAWMKDVMKVMSSHKKQPVGMCQELILFSERPSGGEYEYIKLADLSNFKEKDKIYSSAIIKRQNPYESSDPDKPKPPGRKRHEPVVASNQNNNSIALPRFPSPDPHSVQPGPAGGTSFVQPGPAGRTTSVQPGPTGRTSSVQPGPTGRTTSVQPGPAGGTSSVPRTRPVPAAKGSARPAPRTPNKGSSSPSHAGGPFPPPKYQPDKDQGAYEELSPSSPETRGIYECLSDFPSHADFGKLGIEQVVNCLRLLRLGRHADTFRMRHVDGRMAQCLTEEILVKDFEFRSFDAIQFVMFVKEGWRPK